MGDLRFVAIDENGKEVTIDDLFGFLLLYLDVRLLANVDIALISVMSKLIGAGFEVIRGASPRLKDPFGTNLPLQVQVSNGIYLLYGPSQLSPHRPIAKEPSNSALPTRRHSAAHATPTPPRISHIASLPPDEAARHMCHRLHLGAVDKIKMRALPSIMADAPSNLAKARACTSPFMVTANATKRAHTASRYVESQPGRLIHLDIARPLLESRIGRYSLPDAPPRRLHSFPRRDPHAIT